MMTVSSPTIDEQLAATHAELVRLKQEKVAELRQQLAEAEKTHEQARAETTKRVAAMQQAVAAQRAALKAVNALKIKLGEPVRAKKGSAIETTPAPQVATSGNGAADSD
jgi:cobalamin biosynthesis Mg chelatase CobN